MNGSLDVESELRESESEADEVFLGAKISSTAENLNESG
jgi:hypothetical protein